MKKDQIIARIKDKQFLRSILPALIFLMLMAAILIIYGGRIAGLLSKPENIAHLLADKSLYSALIYIFISIVQIVIAVIPGDPIQIVGGYVFGAGVGFLLTTVGIMIGSSIAFAISRKFGLPVVKYFVSQEKLLYYKERLEHKTALIALFILCAMPAIPKDIVVYAVGLTPMRFKVFFPLYFFARLPAIFLSVYMGQQLVEKDLIGFTIVGVLSLLTLGVGYMVKKKML